MDIFNDELSQDSAYRDFDSLDLPDMDTDDYDPSTPQPTEVIAFSKKKPLVLCVYLKLTYF